MYASLGKDMDMNIGKFQTFYDRISKLSSDYSAATSYIIPEILALPDGKIKTFVKEDATLKIYDHYLDNILRMKAHTLSADEEKLLAKLSPIMDCPDNAYSVLNNAELDFPVIKDKDGNDIKVSHGRYRSALYSPDRDYREKIYKGTYQAYKQVISTIATLYNGRMSTRIINSEIKKYNSPVEAAVYPTNIPVSVYDNLIKAVNDNLSSLHRWADLKKKVLGYKELHPYDTYVSLVPGVEKKYTFDEGKEIVLKALEPMGPEYLKALKTAFDNRWVDVYETEGKRSGAYSNGCGCGVHPWVLLNWNNTLDDVFTLAHEMGHNMHSYFTEKTQPFLYSDYSTFVAEVASTTNEAILLDYLVDHAQTKEEKMSLIEKFLLNVQTTFFRQARFAEFERTAHELTQKGQVLNADDLTKLFADLYQKYWGPSMVTDYEEGLSWARIPHLFNYNFYVFQYATGIAAAQALAGNIKTQGQPAIDRYINNFLKAGNSDYSIEVLKRAGVDMSSPAPVKATIDKFNKYLDQLEKLLNEK
jgi:oligoendopeptidase F